MSPPSPLEGQPTPSSSEGSHTPRRATRVHEKHRYTQLRLRGFLIDACGILDEGEAADHLDRAQLQLLAVAGVVHELIKGSLGIDAEGESIGDLRLKAQPFIRATYQPKLRGNGK